MNHGDVAVSGLADTGLPVGPGNQGHLSLLHKVGQVGSKARAHWDGMGWDGQSRKQGMEKGRKKAC